jgi:3-deoxy-D-manno-octulosonate 8-phosphate phosphatase (KDO 8-P phosphatase)
MVDNKFAKGGRMSPALPVAASDVSLIAFDFDGVLTDNKVYVFQDGSEAVACNRADGLAFDLLRAQGFPTVIISTERNPVVSARAEKLRIPVLQSSADKVAALREHCARNKLDPERAMFVGNDLNDLPIMAASAYALAVADAHPRVREMAWHVLETPGGAGVAREIVERIMDFPPMEDLFK